MLAVIVLISLCVFVSRDIEHVDNECSLSKELIAEIKSYQPIVDKIVAAAVNGPFSGSTWKG